MLHVFSNRAIWKTVTQLLGHGNLIQELWLYITHILFIMFCACYICIFPSLVLLRKWKCVDIDISNKQHMFSCFPTDYSLRNGLLIFFLLVVPVMVFVILGLLYMFRRDSLDPCLKGSLAKRLK